VSNDHRGHGPRVSNGDQVNIFGGQDVIGIQHNHGPGGDQGLTPEMAQLFAQLTTLVAQLVADSRVGTEDRNTLIETLPVVSRPDQGDRHRWRDALDLLATLAHSIGDAATPMLGLVTQLLPLIRS
jgi:hypothetical protein